LTPEGLAVDHIPGNAEDPQTAGLFGGFQCCSGHVRGRLEQRPTLEATTVSQLDQNLGVRNIEFIGPDRSTNFTQKHQSPPT